MSAPDALQRVSDAIATIIGADAGVQAITGRTQTNIVRYRRREKTARPILAYLATDASIRIGTGENYDVTLVLRAEADTASVANALLRAAREALTTQAFDAAGADAVVMQWNDTNLPDDGDGEAPSTNRALVIAEADLTIWITL